MTAYLTFETFPKVSRTKDKTTSACERSLTKMCELEKPTTFYLKFFVNQILTKIGICIQYI